VKQKVHQVQRNQIDSNKVGLCSKCTFWLKHKLAIVLAVRQLHHRSATAPGCTTQLHDMHGHDLPLSEFLATFFEKYIFLFLSSYYQEIPELVAEHRSLLIPVIF